MTTVPRLTPRQRLTLADRFRHLSARLTLPAAATRQAQEDVLYDLQALALAGLGEGNDELRADPLCPRCGGSGVLTRRDDACSCTTMEEEKR